ncbi:aminopeptidase C [Myroides sp. DW712]|uniref:aminopeptidase C n=1 Tax=Myroides sp. DW712 TaxID=3389800 RepID=UPI0039787046
MNKKTIQSWVLTAVLSVITASTTVAQDNLVNALKLNASDKSKELFQFKPVVDIENTSIKNQGSSGTCWSYSANSFIESEMMRMGKRPVEISQIYSARNAYIEKGKMYVRMQGAVTLGDGGAFHDVMNMYRMYGAVPQEVYTGLHYGTKKNQFAEMAAIQEGVLKAVVSNPNGKLTPNWEKAYTAVIDAYLGEVPEKFKWEGKEYTPKTFASEVIGINPEDYIEIGSDMNYPYYDKFVLLVPDNWAFDQVYNVKVNEMTDIIDQAVNNGFTVAWGGDVSEKYFSWKNGVAYVPEKDWEDMSEDERKDIFNGPKPERKVTAEMRQEAFDNYSTTDDHGMHIVGIAKDQQGREFYIVKNSWGVSNDHKGYMYMSKEYVKYKTTDFMVHKDALSKDMKKKLKI